MAIKLSVEERALLVLWGKAGGKGGIMKDCGEARLAKKLRFAMYNVAKRVKAKPGEFTVELLDAITNTMLQVEGQWLIGSPRAEGELCGLLGEEMGVEVVATKEDEKAVESLRRMQERLKHDEENSRRNSLEGRESGEEKGEEAEGTAEYQYIPGSVQGLAYGDRKRIDYAEMVEEREQRRKAENGEGMQEALGQLYAGSESGSAGSAGGTLVESGSVGSGGGDVDKGEEESETGKGISRGISETGDKLRELMQEAPKVIGGEEGLGGTGLVYRELGKNELPPKVVPKRFCGKTVEVRDGRAYADGVLMEDKFQRLFGLI